MRDLVFLTLFVAALPFCLARVHLAIALWYWTSLFQPQTLSFGAAGGAPFAAVAAIVVLISLLFSSGPKLPPRIPLVLILGALGAWTTLTTLHAAPIQLTYDRWSEFLKLLLMVLIGIAVLQTRTRLELLIWTVCACLGFYGFKMGLFALAGGSGSDFRGPSYMGGNNEIARGILISLPLLVYLFLHYKRIWVRAGLGAVALSSAIALILSGSRGAWLGALAMVCFVGARVRHGLAGIALIGIIGLCCVQFLPAAIVQRFFSIEDYQTDASVQGRFGSWEFALQEFPHRPLMGGGFGIFEFEHHVASHNSFFQALGEHGAVGLLLYLLLLIIAWRCTSKIRRAARKRRDLSWAADLSLAIRISLVGYIVGSLSINQAFFPAIYAVIGILASLQIIVQRELAGTDAVHQEAGVPTRRPHPSSGRPAHAAHAAARTDGDEFCPPRRLGFPTVS
jgi:probable O-glycosylation ligase (exosortase A-associated)